MDSDLNFYINAILICVVKFTMKATLGCPADLGNFLRGGLESMLDSGD